VRGKRRDSLAREEESIMGWLKDVALITGWAQAPAALSWPASSRKARDIDSVQIATGVGCAAPSDLSELSDLRT